ncbi:MAG TPA: lysophospholipid acyltransferase family protein [Terriglobia bacterium]|nr:lysophospholipid acyltransferase family protein [Terriglobia bacterium]
METTGRESDIQPHTESGYKVLRALVRGWFGVVFSRIRLLRAELLPDSGAAILVISHPASFLDALILVAAFKRQIHCLLSRDLMRGILRGLIARRLGMIPYDPAGLDRQAALRAAGEALENHRVVVVFADQRKGKSGGPLPIATTAATLALQIVLRHSGAYNLPLFPVHICLPIGPARGGEVVLYVDAPVPLGESLAPREGDPAAKVRKLAETVEQNFQANAFRLHDGDIKNLLVDLEEILRTDLAEDWAERPNWKQNTEGFKLSEFVADWVGQLNSLNPGRLVALRHELTRYREERRRWSLQRFEVEGATWLESLPRRFWLWLESLAGFPVALYGLLNHLAAGATLFWGGLLKKDSGRDSRALWGWRALVVLGFYVAQVLLCAHLLGRAAAGYYALTLPVTGAYLWRYGWLVRNRTRLLLLSVALGRSSDKLAQARKRFIEDLNLGRDAYADALGVPH